MPDSLQFAVTNTTDTDQVWAYMTGIALQHNSQRCLLKADGQSLYFPSSPSEILQPLTEDCAIPLGAPGNTKTLTIPQIAGGRLWISKNSKLTFLLNPGPALVEPSVLNPSDPNASVDFGFCEFTLNDAQLYANISYVDFVPRTPIAIALDCADGSTQTVQGMEANGLDAICEGLVAQSRSDGRAWEKLVVKDSTGRNFRALNATHGDAVGADFQGYFEPYVERVWDKYRSSKCHIDTQAGPGVLSGSVDEGSHELVIGDERFGKPSTADILGCNSGPFTTGPSATRNAIIPRLAAAFVRSTLLTEDVHPSAPAGFYREEVTNHYARVVHQCQKDGKGYAFAYDDVQPEGGEDQSGKVNAGDPRCFRVVVGGGGLGGGSGGAPVQAQQQRGGKPEYVRGPPPPPPQQQQDEVKGGFRSHLKGFAQRVLH